MEVGPDGELWCPHWLLATSAVQVRCGLGYSSEHLEMKCPGGRCVCVFSSVYSINQWPFPPSWGWPHPDRNRCGHDGDLGMDVFQLRDAFLPQGSRRHNLVVVRLSGNVAKGYHLHATHLYLTPLQTIPLSRSIANLKGGRFLQCIFKIHLGIWQLRRTRI